MALARRAGARAREANALVTLAISHYRTGDVLGARDLFAQCLEIARAHGRHRQHGELRDQPGRDAVLPRRTGQRRRALRERGAAFAAGGPAVDRTPRPTPTWPTCTSTSGCTSARRARSLRCSNTRVRPGSSTSSAQATVLLGDLSARARRRRPRADPLRRRDRALRRARPDARGGGPPPGRGRGAARSRRARRTPPPRPPRLHAARGAHRTRGAGGSGTAAVAAAVAHAPALGRTRGRARGAAGRDRARAQGAQPRRRVERAVRLGAGARAARRRVRASASRRGSRSRCSRTSRCAFRASTARPSGTTRGGAPRASARCRTRSARHEAARRELGELATLMGDARAERLLDIIKRLASEHDLDRLLQRITECAVDLSGAERGYVLLVDASGQLERRVMEVRQVRAARPARGLQPLDRRGRADRRRADRDRRRDARRPAERVRLGAQADAALGRVPADPRAARARSACSTSSTGAAAGASASRRWRCCRRSPIRPRSRSRTRG